MPARSASDLPAPAHHRTPHRPHPAAPRSLSLRFRPRRLRGRSPRRLAGDQCQPGAPPICPHLRIIGPPTGRILLHRDPFPFDFDLVASEAARRGVWLEINASPERLDLHGTLIRTARAKGAKFTISTDAHHPKQLASMRYGVVTARRGWLGPHDILNTLGAEEFARAIQAKS